MNKAKLLASVVIFASVAQAPVAMAQSATDQAGDGRLEEIVVTAQRREERLQDVPVSVTAVTAAKLEAQGVSSVQNLQRLAPALSIANFPGDNLTASISLRGLFSSDGLPTVDPTVGIYLDGVYIARASGANLNMIDVERVEVLRGPQGTLFGRNTIGGAINIVSAKPKGEFGGSAEVGYGNYNAFKVQGVVNAPLTDTVAVRLVGMHRQHDGYARSSITGAQLNRDNTEYVRGSLAWQLDDNWDLLVVGDYTGTKYRGGQWVVPVATFGIADTLIQLLSGGTDSAANYNGLPISKRPATTGHGTYNARVWGVGGTLTGQVGDVTVKTIIAYRDLYRLHTGTDLDGTPYPILDSQDLLDTQHQLSTEVQVLGRSLEDRLNWIVGAYYFEESGHNFSHAHSIRGILPNRNVTDGRSENTSTSFFGQATYSLTDALRFTAGVRWVRDTRLLDSRNLSETPAGAFVGCNLTIATAPLCVTLLPQAKFKYVPFTVGLDYRVNPDTLVYAKLSRGYRAGGYNLRGSDINALSFFGPERVDSYEVGFKADLLDRRLRFNLAAYHSNYTNIQLTAVIGTSSGGITSTVQNAGEGRINGVEAELTAVLGPLTLGASYGYIDAKYTKLLPSVTSVTLNSPFQLTAKHSLNLEADYTARLWDGAKLVLHADYAYKTRINFASIPTANPANTQGPVGLFGARAMLAMDNGLSVSVWGQNLGNKRYLLRTLNIEAIGSVNGSPGDPRTFGGSVAYKF
ncbi:MAG: TonB-dependent receptor [Novosphingobium sp.]|nr:TonB-dependent receptor [Novosphingobium sp.]